MLKIDFEHKTLF